MIEKLPPRERQVFDTLVALREASVADIQSRLPDRLSASAVRAMLTRLERKGYVARRTVDQRNLYAPALPVAAARKSALRQLVRTFFDDSPVSAATALLGMQRRLDPDDLEELERLIRKARKEQPE